LTLLSFAQLTLGISGGRLEYHGHDEGNTYENGKIAQNRKM